MLQIVIDKDHIKYIEDIGQVLSVVTAIWHLIKSSRAKLNFIITENVNRVREELIEAINTRFDAHDKCDEKIIERITSLESKITDMKK